MIKEIMEDSKVNDYRVTPIVILVIYRISNSIYYSRINNIFKKSILIILKIFQKIFIEVVFGVEIKYEAKIGGGLRIVHPQNIIIASTATIGEYCTIYNGVTIGVNEHAHIKKAGDIGSNVYMGSGSKIIGSVKIGANCRIGANAVVFKDIKENTTVVSEQRIIEH